MQKHSIAIRPDNQPLAMLATLAEQINFIPALASLLISQWREKHQAPELAGENQAQPDTPNP